MTTTDGLGRIIQVTEKGILPGSADANTYYTYDGLDNLIGVNQSGQTRSFTYDSLGRMTQAVNGESGTTCYTYDNNGNLSTRLQGANSACSSGTGILTSYNYDYLNRLTSKVMPEGTVTYTYDQGTYGLGRLYSVSYGNATTTYNVHDPLGRVTNHTQTVGGINYAFGYSYNGSNNLTNITYPSGRQEVLTYDTAGRVGQVATNGIANAGSVTYAAHGGIAAFQMGNGLWETTNYNSRLQTSQISLGSCAQTTGPGTPGCSQDQWWLANNYGSTTNNGNLLQQTIGLPGSIQIPEAYSYDKANRLLVASEQSSNPSNPPCPDGSARYVEGFQYDVWGNRTVPCLTGLGSATLAPSFFDSNTNRISAGAGWVYDSAGLGNIVQEPYLNGYRMYLYDSENRQIAFCTQDAGGCVNQDGAGRTRYLYDGDGRRVEKRDSTGVTVYVYDILCLSTRCGPPLISSFGPL